MSIKSMTWAFSQPLGGNEKVILLALADYADDDGLCWPSIPMIAKKACLSDRTVQRYLITLADQGYLSLVKRSDATNRKIASQYVLHVHGDKQDDFDGDNLSPYGDKLTGYGDTAVTTHKGTVTNNRKEVTINRRGTRVPDVFAPDDSAYKLASELGVAITTLVVDSFLDYWRTVPGAKGEKLDWQATFRNQIRHLAKSNTNATTQNKHSIANSFAAVDAFIERQERELAAAQNSA